MEALDVVPIFDHLLREVQRPQAWVQILALALCLGLAWLLARAIRQSLRVRIQDRELGEATDRLLRTRGLRAIGDLLFPVLAWLLLLLIQFIGQRLRFPVSVLHLGMVLLFSFVIVRLTVHALRRVFMPSAMLEALERFIAVVVWIGVALHVLGLLPEFFEMADAIGITFGKVRISLLQLAQGVVTVGVAMVFAMWAGAALETRLMSSTTMDSSLRAVLSRTGNAVLIVVALLVSMSLVGIDLTVLSIFWGALGVGLGLGFQRIASSYVSGFIILLDRSLRLGDLITVDKYSGTVTQIRTRYTVLTALDGNDAIIPNDLLISQPVLNHTFSSKEGRVAVKIQISYDSDVDKALELLIDAARSEARVLVEPPPKAFLAGFSIEGIDIESGFWVADPEKGTLGVRSAINRRIWKSFLENGIHVPRTAGMGAVAAVQVKPGSSLPAAGAGLL